MGIHSLVTKVLTTSHPIPFYLITSVKKRTKMLNQGVSPILQSYQLPVLKGENSQQLTHPTYWNSFFFPITVHDSCKEDWPLLLTFSVWQCHWGTKGRSNDTYSSNITGTTVSFYIYSISFFIFIYILFLGEVMLVCHEWPKWPEKLVTEKKTKTCTLGDKRTIDKKKTRNVRKWGHKWNLNFVNVSQLEHLM